MISIGDWRNGPGYRVALSVNKEKKTVTFQPPQYARYTAEIPWHCFMGTIGTAPSKGECHHSLTRGGMAGTWTAWRPRRCHGISPVNIPGAVWSIGDMHIAQGDGETCGTAVECRSWVTVDILPVIRARGLTRPGSRTMSTSCPVGMRGRWIPLTRSPSRICVTGWCRITVLTSGMPTS